MKRAKRKPEQSRPANKAPTALPRQETQPLEQQRLLVRRQELSGPLPDPVTFQHYNTVLPGAAERILAMAEENAKHAREMDKAVLSAQLQLEQGITVTQRIGQACGVLAASLVLGVAAYAIKCGYPTTAAVLGGTTIVGLVTVFVQGRKEEQTPPPNEQKRKEEGPVPPG